MGRSIPRNWEDETEYAGVCWMLADLKARRPSWSKKKCHAFLRKHAEAIFLAATEAGNAKIGEFLKGKESV